MERLRPTSPVLYTTLSPPITASPFNGSSIIDSDGSISEIRPEKPKQKRNKPTLSCEDAIEDDPTASHVSYAQFCLIIKLKVNGLAGIKRQTVCTYAHVANILEVTNRSLGNTRRVTKPPKKKINIPNGHEVLRQVPTPNEESLSRASASSSLGLLSNVPYSHPTASNVFGIGSEHPFANYWTCQGGLPEVISVLPDKLQADILLERYFECVDPVYPMIHRQTFYADYEHFWSLPQAEKDYVDAALVALVLAMMALGTQFVTTTSPKERQQTAEFYVSAAHQALRMSSYLNKASVRSIQAMVLVTYFLINDNHASDGWAFAGILIRQAYAMGLHRDPNIVCPNASVFEKQLRRILWQAVLLQDTFLTVLLSLPPSATHTDVNVEDLIDDSSSIANSNPTDTAFIRGCWTLANLVQESICSPRSLQLPISSTPRQKSKLLADFRAVHRSLPDVFRSWDTESITLLCQVDKRVVRQTLFLTSNYFHCIMLVHASASEEVPINAKAALEAAHEAIQSFFLLYGLFESEAKVWWVFNHRAFLEALCIGNVLRDQMNQENGKELLAKDPLFLRAKADIVQMIGIMQCMSGGEGGGSEVAKTRVSVLSNYL